MKTRNAIAALAAVAAALVVSACAPRNSINADTLNAVATPVLIRHDAYVLNDPNLDPVEREVYLRSSAMMRATINEALGLPPQEPALSPAP